MYVSKSTWYRHYGEYFDPSSKTWIVQDKSHQSSSESQDVSCPYVFSDSESSSNSDFDTSDVCAPLTDMDMNFENSGRQMVNYVN